MAYISMTNVVMDQRALPGCLYSRCLHSYGLYSHGLHNYGLHSYGSDGASRLLLEARASVSAADSRGDTALHAAAAGGHKPVLQVCFFIQLFLCACRRASAEGEGSDRSVASERSR